MVTLKDYETILPIRVEIELSNNDVYDPLEPAVFDAPNIEKYLLFNNN